MSTQLLTELPSIQYTGMDFESVMAELQEIVRNNPKWAENWSEFYSSEAGTMLLQLMSWICDNLSIRQDVLLNESFLSTANKKRNKIKLLKTIGYQPKLSHAAQAALTIELSSVTNEDVIITPEFSSSSESLTLRTNNIARITGKDINNNTINWEILSLVDGKPDYLAGVKLKAGSTSYTTGFDDNTIFAVEGETLYKEFSSGTSDGPYIDLYESNIAADSIEVYEKSNAKKCQKVSSFITSEAMDKSGSVGIPYIVSLNEDGSIRISFAKRNVLPTERLLPAGTEVSIFYRTTSGSIGNIPPSFINTSTVFTTTSGENVDAIVYNEATAYNGTDNEEIDTAVLNAPLTLRTFDRAVTVEDFDIILNNYPGLLKAKTYTASNNPNNFYQAYGRYINPQEAFIFALGNRDYSKVPSAQYNNYPWLNLFKTPRLNEKYTFDNGANNVNTLFSNTYYNFNLFQDNGENVKEFSNATIINIGSDFNAGIQSNLTNPNFQLKLSTEPVETSYFSDIPYSLMEDGNTVLVTDLGDNKEIAIDCNARFVSQESYAKETDDTVIDAIDIIDSRYIIVSLDERTEIVIDLWENYDQEHMPSGHYYVFFDYNNPRYDAPADDDSMSAAYGRHGIVQLINSQIAAISGGSQSQAEAADEYTENNAYQWLGLSIGDAATAEVLSFDEGYQRKDLILTIKYNNEDRIFKFPFSPDSGTNSKTYENFITELNNNLNTYENIRVFNGESWVKFTSEDYDLSTLKFNIGHKLVYSDSGYSYTYDIFVKGSGNWLTTDNEIIISYNEVAEADSEDDTYNHCVYNRNNTSLIHAVHKEEDTTKPVEDLLGKNLKACSYQNLASFVDDPLDDKKGYLVIKSPLTGKNSSIRFITNSTIEDGYGNFIKGFLNVPFYPDEGLGFSQPAFGQKKILLISSNNPIGSYKEDFSSGDDPISLPDGSLETGNLIFENSCIYSNLDFNSIYAFYKFESTNEIVLGSVYDNFYYTGEPEIDENVKDKLKYITGTVIKDSKVDNIRSNFEVKLTKGPRDTNSFYNINEDLGVVRSDKVEIVSANISGGFPNANLVFTFDDISPEYKLSVDFNEVQNGPQAVTKIKNAITSSEYYDDEENIYADYIESINSIVKTSYKCLNQVSLSGLSREDGSIVFYYDNSASENDVKTLYKLFLGTNKTNSEFYELYPKSSVNVDNIVSEGEGAAEEYYYYPTIEYPLIFKYRKMIGGVSKSADYYITYDNGNKKYLLVKTPTSTFPSTYFYVHFINDRSSEDLEIDEKALNSYMNDKKISGMDLYFAEPYFKGYDIKATIYYNANFSEASVKSFVEENVKKLCSIENAEIGGYMSQAKIIKEIMNVDGVENVVINYFGYNYETSPESVTQLNAEFFEILFLNDYEEGKHGLMFEYEVQR